MQKETKYLLESFEKDMGIALSENFHSLFFGRYAGNPANFNFQPGEHVLIRKLVQVVADICSSEKGHAFFQCKKANKKACDKEMYGYVTKTNIGLFFCPNTTELEKKIKSVDRKYRKSKAVPKNRLKNTAKNIVGENGILDETNNDSKSENNESENEGEDGVPKLILKRKELQMLRISLSSKVKEKYFSASCDFGIKFLSSGSEGKEVINDSAEFFNTKHDYKIIAFFGEMKCKCGVSQKLDYYFKNKQCNSPITLDFIETIYASLKTTSSKLSGYWHTTNFDKHFRSHSTGGNTEEEKSNVNSNSQEEGQEEGDLGVHLNKKLVTPLTDDFVTKEIVDTENGLENTSEGYFHDSLESLGFNLAHSPCDAASIYSSECSALNFIVEGRIQDTNYSSDSDQSVEMLSSLHNRDTQEQKEKKSSNDRKMLEPLSLIKLSYSKSANSTGPSLTTRIPSLIGNVNNHSIKENGNLNSSIPSMEKVCDMINCNSKVPKPAIEDQPNLAKKLEIPVKQTADKGTSNHILGIYFIFKLFSNIIPDLLNQKGYVATRIKKID